MGRSLPYSNGKVGMWGGSYVGATQMLAAIAHPPHLAGICPVVTASNYHDKLDLPGRRVRTMVQRIVDFRVSARYLEPDGLHKLRTPCRELEFAANKLSSV